MLHVQHSSEWSSGFPCVVTTMDVPARAETAQLVMYMSTLMDTSKSQNLRATAPSPHDERVKLAMTMRMLFYIMITCACARRTPPLACFFNPTPFKGLLFKLFLRLLLVGAQYMLGAVLDRRKEEKDQLGAAWISPPRSGRRANMISGA